MANEQNLLPMMGRKLSTEEARKMGSAGGKASGEKRARRRLMRDALSDLLLQPCPVPELREALRKLGLPDDMQTAVLFGQIRQAMQGGTAATEAAKFLRDTVGERPADTVNVTAGVDPARDDLRQLSDADLERLAGDDATLLPASAEDAAEGG